MGQAKPVRVSILTGFVLLVTACGGGDRVTSIPPCNAWIFLWGNADLRLDCPARDAIPLIKREQDLQIQQQKTEQKKK